MLGHGGIQVVLDHQHDGGSLWALGRIVADGAGVHRVARHEAVHVDAAVVLQFLSEFRRQRSVPVLGK